MDKLQIGHLVFVRGSGWVSHAIENITHSAYSHVALAVAEDTLIEAQFREPVECVPATKYKGRADVFTASLTEKQIDTAIRYAKTKRGETYGDKLIFEEFVHDETGIQLPFHEKGRPICSVLVVNALRHAGLPICQGVQYPDPGDIVKDGLYTFSFSY